MEWYKDRDFPEVKASNADIVAVIQNPKQLQRVIDEHNRLEGEVYLLRKERDDARKEVLRLTTTIEKNVGNYCDADRCYPDKPCVNCALSVAALDPKPDWLKEMIVKATTDTEKFDTQVKYNLWHKNLDEVIEAIKKFSAEDAEWSWIRNSLCKYISLRVDMRDGAFVLVNKDGIRISLEQLKEQHTYD